MSNYTTGELAEKYALSVRTIQFYDQEGILHPSSLSEGGRRLYDDDDVKKLQKIIILKNLGLSIKDIKAILNDEKNAESILVLLGEREKALEKDLADKIEQKERLALLKDALAKNALVSLDALEDVAVLAKSKKKLRWTHLTMLILGILADGFEIAALFLWILQGIYWPFIVMIPVVIALAFALVILYWRNVSYVCPNCGTTFHPRFRAMMNAYHTPRTRRLVCPHCHEKHDCVEIGSKD